MISENYGVKTQEFMDMFCFLLNKVTTEKSEVLLVENIADWCRQNGIPENDSDRPVRIVRNGKGYIVLVREEIPDSIIEQRIRAAEIRDQVLDVAQDKGKVLSTLRTRLAFLFLNEFAHMVPENHGDDLLADSWTFDFMKKIGYLEE